MDFFGLGEIFARHPVFEHILAFRRRAHVHIVVYMGFRVQTQSLVRECLHESGFRVFVCPGVHGHFSLVTWFGTTTIVRNNVACWWALTTSLSTLVGARKIVRVTGRYYIDSIYIDSIYRRVKDRILGSKCHNGLY